MIGHNVVLATLNHNLDPEHRGDIIPAPIHIGKNVWIGANATVLAGVYIYFHALNTLFQFIWLFLDFVKKSIVNDIPAFYPHNGKILKVAFMYTMFL